MVPGALAGAGVGAGLGLVNNLLGGGGDPGAHGGFDTARQYLNQVNTIAGNYLGPYSQAGREAGPRADALTNRMRLLYEQGDLPPLYGRMTRDPMAYVNEIMRGYSPSEGYRYRQRKMLDQQRAASAAGGFVGTPQDQERQSDIVRGQLGQDMQEWLSNIFGTQQAGAAGTERLLGGRERALQRQLQNEVTREERGYTAADAMSRILAQNAAQQAGLGFQSGMDREAAQTNRRRELMSLISGGILSGAALGSGGDGLF